MFNHTIAQDSFVLIDAIKKYKIDNRRPQGWDGASNQSISGRDERRVLEASALVAAAATKNLDRLLAEK